MRASFLVLFILSSTLLFDCSKKEDPLPVICYPTKFINAIGSETLTYNDSRQVIRIIDDNGASGTDTITFSYDANGDVLTGIFGDGRFWTYTHDSNHLLTQRLLTPGGEAMNWEYNDNGQITLITYVNPACGTCGYTRELTYVNSTTHNYTGETLTNATDVIAITYEYDSHPNQLRLVIDSSTRTDNNITSKVSVYSGGTANITYTYTYNERGYPLTQTSSTGVVNSYTYDCQER